MHPAGLLLPREAREICEIGGYTIPSKAKVLINRNNFELLSFGVGRRICPRISFSTSNIEPGLSQLLYNFDWKLPNGNKLEDLNMTGNFGIMARTKNNLLVLPPPGFLSGNETR
ncbi:hypothetical protein QYF36_007393 [Acer negundo]|nr:hypothetical protein QYF36_007393 [Acer negundo]